MTPEEKESEADEIILRLTYSKEEILSKIIDEIIEEERAAMKEEQRRLEFEAHKFALEKEREEYLQKQEDEVIKRLKYSRTERDMHDFLDRIADYLRQKKNYDIIRK